MGQEALIIIAFIIVVSSLSFLFKCKERPYILNKSTYEIHNKTCPCVEDMKNSNKRYITKEKRDKIIAKNYESICGRCKSK